jgi:CBS domain-containing protein
LKAREVMTKDPWTCGETASLAQAARVMWENDVGFVPVVDGDGRARGTITDRDICMAALSTGLRLDEIPVSHAMAKSVFKCRHTDSLETVERIMGDKQIRRIPVVNEDDRIIGVIAQADVAQAERDSSRVHGTVQAISMPRPRAVE